MHDPDGTESTPGSSAGLGLLPIETVLKSPKLTTITDFSWNGKRGRGYEIHMGQTSSPHGQHLVQVDSRNAIACEDVDGCLSDTGRILGTYMHGLFDSPDVTRQWLTMIGLGHITTDLLHGPMARDAAYDQLAEHASRYLDIAAITRLLPQHLRGTL